MTMINLVRKCSITFALYFGCIVSCYPVFGQDTREILDLQLYNGTLGLDTNFTCSVTPIEAAVEWLFNSEPLKIVKKYLSMKM